MRPTFVLSCLALLCGLATVRALSFPDVIDEVSEAFSSSDRALKFYMQRHGPGERTILRYQLAKLKSAYGKLIDTPVTGGLFARLKQAYKPVIDELISEIEGALGFTRLAAKKLKA